MKKLTSIIIILLMLITSPVVNAADNKETNEVKGAGIKPDSKIYFIDKAFEKLSLKLTSSEEKKIKKMIKYANERYAETYEMNEDGKTNLVEKTIEEYSNNIVDISNRISKLSVKDKDIAKLEDNLDNLIVATDDFIEKIPEDIQKEVNNKKEYAYVTPSIIQDIDNEIVKKLRDEEKFGYGEISKLYILSQITEEEIDDLVEEYNEKDDFDELCEEYGLKVSDLVSKALENKNNKIQDKLNKAMEGNNSKLMNSLANKLFQANSQVYRQELKELVDEEYDRLLEEYDVESFDDLSSEEKKEFNNSIEEYTNEKKEELDKELTEKQDEIKGKIDEIISNNDNGKDNNGKDDDKDSNGKDDDHDSNGRK